MNIDDDPGEYEDIGEDAHTFPPSVTSPFHCIDSCSDVMKWDSADTMQWLKETNLEDFREAFIEHEITPSNCLTFLCGNALF